jgi:cytochrome b involved in lipid metabolism
MSPSGENNGGEDAMNVISMEEVGRHHLAQDAWVVVDGKVYE